MQTLDELVNSNKRTYTLENFHEMKLWELLYLSLGEEKELFFRVVFSEFFPVVLKIETLREQNNNAKIKEITSKYLHELEVELDTEPFSIISYVYEKPIFEALNFFRNYPIKEELSFYQSSLTKQEKDVINLRKGVLEKMKDLQDIQSLQNLIQKPKFIYQVLLQFRPFLRLMPIGVKSNGIKNNLLEFGSILLKDYLKRIFYNDLSRSFEEENTDENKKKIQKLTMPQKNLIMHFLLSKHDIDDRKGKDTTKLIQDLCDIEGFENLYKAVRNPFETNDKNWRMDDLKAIKPYFERLGLDEIVKKIEEQKRK